MNDTLNNGARVLYRMVTQAGILVLAFWEGHAHPYVTWRLDNDGNAYWGHYHRDKDSAQLDFNQRAALIQ